MNTIILPAMCTVQMRAKAKMEMAGEVMERGIDIAGRRNNLRSSYHLRAVEVMMGRKGGDDERISIH